MSSAENYLHTTHRTVTWFVKASDRTELQLAAPFQRNPVWTTQQKAYLIDTILQGLPIPELYMVDEVNNEGAEHHTVVDGQQRIRACLEFLQNKYRLQGDEIDSQWKGLYFEKLTADQKQLIYGYKFVVRILPKMSDVDLRKIFARLNRNVVALNEQELRNATYWGEFITSIQKIAEEDFWSEFGLFTANDHRRMIDHEYISELAIAYLHGAQNKKDNLEDYYQLYEETFEAKDNLIKEFSKTVSEIQQLIGNKPARWRKKSDFYTLFLALSNYSPEFPWPSDTRKQFAEAITAFGDQVTTFLTLDEPTGHVDEQVRHYAAAVSRAASDKQSRVIRDTALRNAIGLSRRRVPL
jgi:hypothetical protein